MTIIPGDAPVSLVNQLITLLNFNAKAIIGIIIFSIGLMFIIRWFNKVAIKIDKDGTAHGGQTDPTY